MNIRPDQVDDFAAQLQPGFYADPETMREAILHGRSFNLIHVESVFKFDIFPLSSDEFSQTQFRRRQFRETRFGDTPIECAFATAEDTVLSKLIWYRSGGETSSQQWNDLRGILRAQNDHLDLQYLNLWAPRLGVADLLRRLLEEDTAMSLRMRIAMVLIRPFTFVLPHLRWRLACSYSCGMQFTLRGRMRELTCLRFR